MDTDYGVLPLSTETEVTPMPPPPMQIQMSSAAVDEIALFVNRVLFSVMTWVSTTRPDRKLLQILNTFTVFPMAFQLTPREIAYLLKSSWPRIFLLQAVEYFLRGEDGGKLSSFLATLNTGYSSPDYGSTSAVEIIESFIRLIIEHRPSSDEICLLKNLCLFSAAGDYVKQTSHDCLSYLLTVLHQNLPSFIRMCTSETSVQRHALLRCFSAIENLPEIACYLIRVALQRIYGFSMENLDIMIERMTIAAVEAANQAGARPP
ncbi:hypothetical protein Aperf_G00000120032 [Anoplocephala perfoliata]